MRVRTVFRTLVLQAFVLLSPVVCWAQVTGSGSGTPSAQPVSGEATRAATLDAERTAKAAASSPPQRSSVEQKLYWYDNQQILDKIFSSWHGFHLAGGDFPAGAGTKFGVGFDSAIRRYEPDDPNRVTVSARAALSTRGYNRIAGSVGLHRLANAPIDISLGAQRYEFPQEDFFGFGQDSAKANRTDYLLESTDIGADVHWNPVRLVTVGAGFWHLDPRTRVGTDSRFPAIETIFAPATLPGFDSTSDFTRADTSVAFDWRDNPLHPHAGGRYLVRLASYRDQDSSAFDFKRTEVDLQQYVPLPNRYRTLAFRAAAVFTDPDSGATVPFFYQPTLGGAQALRGFREFRFRDRDSLLLSAEYRWEAWWALDGAFFIDAGQVAADRHDFSFGAMETSYGVGFRVHSNRAFVARLDLAFSREGFIPLLRFEHAF